MFEIGDANRDGMVTLEELRQTIVERRNRSIQERFRRIDSDKNGQIDVKEFTTWQAHLGSLAGNELSATAPGTGIVAEEIFPKLENGMDGEVFRRLIKPLNATNLVAANTNYDAGTTLDELLVYERQFFDELDLDHDGELSMQEVRAPLDKDRFARPPMRRPRD